MTEQNAEGRVGHTPGPWLVNGEVREVGGADGTKHMLYCADIVLGSRSEGGWRGYIASIQSCDHLGNGITREEAESNARLIAAAPDLLKALEELRGRCEGEVCDGGLLDRVDEIIAAAKAVQP